MLGSFWLNLLACIGLALLAVYYIVKENYTYFKKKGIPYDDPVFILGNTWRSALFLENMIDTFTDLYAKFPGTKLVGVFQGMKPAYLVRDPEVVHRVMIKDFSHFHDRGFKTDEVTNPLEGNLFNLTGTKWKTLRNKLTPTFTSGKLKGMFPLMDSCVDSFIEYLDTVADQEVEIKDALCRLTTDVIGSCAFGIDAGSIKNPDSQFRLMGKKIFEPSFLTFMKNMARFIMPSIALKMKLKTFPDDINDFFFSITKQNFDMRLKTGEKRNDFVQLLLELREKGEVKTDPMEQKDEDDAYLYSATQDDHLLEDNGKLVINDNLLTAQAFAFFAAGFETSATSLSFIVYLLSKHQDVQEKLRQEVRAMRDKYGSMSYDALKAMKYLDACIDEGMRLYPPIGVLFRSCNKNLTLEDGTVLESGNPVIIPVKGIHKDPENYPQPDLYRPERFIESPPAPGAFMPFGDGPRVCIAQRFALIELKLTLAKIVDNFRIETCPKMAALEPIKLNPKAFITSPMGGIYVRMRKLKA